MFTLAEWNINPNQDWYIKLSDATTEISVELYESSEDALSSANLIASGTCDFGTEKECTLVMEDGAGVTISFFNGALAYHLKVSGQSGDQMTIIHLFPFVDLPEINDSIYRSEDLILRKVTYEINAHTHVAVDKSVFLATVIEGLDINDIVKLSSSFRGQETYNIVDGITITGTKNSLLSTVEMVEYKDFVRV